MSDAIDKIADDYVSLGLHLHQHDPNPFIYLGDPSRRRDAAASPMPLPALRRALEAAAASVNGLDGRHCRGGEQRWVALTERLEAMVMRAAMLEGETPASFDEEVHALYSVAVPRKDENHFRELASELAQVIPGTGPLPDRIATFRNRFLLPPARIEAAMQAALAEARQRTRAHIELPDDESIDIAVGTDMPFSGFAEYRGGGKTVVHFSDTQPLHADRVIELATHEAYPGHHVQGTLIEAELIDNRGWIEWQMLPLFGAHTVLAEGAANYGVGLAFNRDERIEFDRDVVLPIAGLSEMIPALHDFHRYVDLVEQLNYARNEAARGYLYDGWTREQTLAWLQTFGLETPATAMQRVGVIEALRGYVVTYNHGLDWVTAKIDGDDNPDRATRWQRLSELLRRPDLPTRTPADA